MMQQQDGGKYLIYAEDDIDDREIFAEMMLRVNADIEVVTLENGRQVLDYLGELDEDAVLPCFILLDVNMPVMDGYRTLQKLKSQEAYRDITVIMYTTASHEIEKRKSAQFGASKFITKPFRLAEIEDIVREFARYCEVSPSQRK